MKIIQLADKVYVKLLKGQDELYERDFRDFPKGCTPGEWVILSCEKEHNFAAYINPFATNGIIGRVVSLLPEAIASYSAELLVKEAMVRAIHYRGQWKDLIKGARLIHGQADGLPGLIVDQYSNAILVQVNTAGMEIHRQLIASVLAGHFSLPIYFLDHPEYRQNEVLPIHSGLALPETLEIEESGFRYSLPFSMIQKIGYYYDHRPNRQKLRQTLKSLKVAPKRGLDLFSYMGSWGLHMLDGGVGHVTFVDQGNFADIYQKTMKLNQIDDARWTFARGDVFNLLDQLKNQGQVFDIIVSDPPAFKKKEQNKDKALGGYTKLHTKILSLLAPNSLMVAGSCTHGVSLAELDHTVYEASMICKRTIKQIDIGIQGSDHPFAHFSSKEHYIKYLLYYVE